ncbi:hypothetical protein C789_4736 [Microcystis aeruginosa FACHB-905 = DIANCHI905]|uniref:Uncharacterized protein n=1 Tax=Microcystis aeruginosa PCC 7806SL TaxID=1903187 RepID=A0AB33BTC3_MICA7|nr:hypothetical protein BH695_0446 [Microcystis aeruginosa PCC 7806SL]ELS45494.1 hypothetical protein C789_4736 [Microcystis aeruginosa FACHB-905 = DIANCHI905]
MSKFAKNRAFTLLMCRICPFVGLFYHKIPLFSGLKQCQVSSDHKRKKQMVKTTFSSFSPDNLG